jgi:ribA/ribD-fused uncharacterized protein
MDVLDSLSVIELRQILKCIKANANTENIMFYEPKRDYYEFSNFYKTNIEYNGKIYPSSEHLYQAMKFMKDLSNKRSIEYADIIRQQNTANKAFILASQKIGGGYAWRLALNPIIESYQDVKIRDDWEDKKVEIMKCILIKKFSDTKLRKLLLSTKDKKIIEDSPRDNFWGIGKKKDGKNILGKLLMEVRELLRKKLCEEHLPPKNLPYTNWVCYPNFLVGTYPRSNDVDKIKNLDLYEFRDDIKKYNFPIADGKITTDREALKIAEEINKMLEDGNKVYLHCQGGKGRAGTIAAIVLMLQGKTLKESLVLLKKSINSRKIPGKCPRMPQTRVQRFQLGRIYKKIINSK